MFSYLIRWPLCQTMHIGIIRYRTCVSRMVIDVFTIYCLVHRSINVLKTKISRITPKQTTHRPGAENAMRTTPTKTNTIITIIKKKKKKKRERERKKNTFHSSPNSIPSSNSSLGPSPSHRVNKIASQLSCPSLTRVSLGPDRHHSSIPVAHEVRPHLLDSY